MSDANVSRGVLYSVGILINRIVPSRLFRFRVFRVFELQRPARVSESDGEIGSSVELRQCDSEQDRATAMRVTHFEASEAALADDRYSALLAWEGEQTIGGLWQAHSRFDEDELGMRIELESDQVWVFAAYVDKSHRRRGVYRILLTEVLGSDSTKAHIASINPTNRRSIAAHQRYIVGTFGTCWAMRVLGIAIAFSTGRLSLQRSGTLNCRERPLLMRINS